MRRREAEAEAWGSAGPAEILSTLAAPEQGTIQGENMSGLCLRIETHVVCLPPLVRLAGELIGDDELGSLRIDA
jgi:hypothetical protein